jgi:hypothetical protein
MNFDQMKRYRCEWNDTWKVLLKLGRKPEDKDAERKRFHVRIGAVDRRGQPKSSKIFNNADFDRFRKLCASYTNPASLAAQIEIDAMPAKRALIACEPLLDELMMDHAKREAYVAGIYRNIQRGRPQIRELHEMPDEDLGIVLAALTHTVSHKVGVEHNHPTTGKGPRARYAHRVGHRRAGAEPTPAELESAANRMMKLRLKAGAIIASMSARLPYFERQRWQEKKLNDLARAQSYCSYEQLNEDQLAHLISTLEERQATPSYTEPDPDYVPPETGDESPF